MVSSGQACAQLGPARLAPNRLAPQPLGFPAPFLPSSSFRARVAPGKSGPHEMARGSSSLLSSHGRGLGPQDALKKDSRGLSRVTA